MTPMNMIDDNTERADAYKILADLFSKPPDREHLQAIKEDLELKSAEDEEEIRSDFHSVLIYPGGKLPPVASLFLSRTGSNSVLPIMELYAEAGLTIGDEFLTLPDHLSLEFLFMSYLVSTKKLDLQNRFLEFHLMNWVPSYCEEVKKEAKTFFYKEIAGITFDFLESEYENFE